MTHEERLSWDFVKTTSICVGVLASVFFFFYVLGGWGLAPIAGMFFGLAYVADEKLKGDAS